MSLARMLVTVLLLGSVCGAATVRFSGELSRGNLYERKLPNGLWFCLFPEPDANTGGWLIAVETSCRPDGHDFVAVATAPFHGVNPREINGWHFDPGANAPQRVREFSFVLNDRDWQRLMTDLNTYRDPEWMLKQLDEFGRGKGTLTITAIRRDTVSGKSVLVGMSFSVILKIPDK